jgi:hypothetical protein
MLQEFEGQELKEARRLVIQNNWHDIYVGIILLGTMYPLPTQDLSYKNTQPHA